jgi:hypothetical protein
MNRQQQFVGEHAEYYRRRTIFKEAVLSDVPF